MPGARCTHGLVCKIVRRNAHEHTGSAEALRHSLRNGFTAYAALSPATNSSCHRHRRIEGLVAPGWARKDLRRLDTSNGCQDHTVLPYAAARLRQPPSSEAGLRRVKKGSTGFGAVRLVRLDRSRKNRPAIPGAPDAAASTASHPNVRDDGQRPLVRDETGRVMDLIWGKREGIYFCRGVWTGQITLIWFRKLVFWRSATWSENAASSSVVKAHCVVRRRSARRAVQPPRNFTKTGARDVAETL
jgi:hypothetical protein